ncbi:GAF domain-containing protein [Microvirga sp. ACRRW]|uniref:HWE histidine kinase domain-containing protein n=1 Tax=Microvirga sp. ACRRW TaxID=2918205 RepID=UPI001EF6C675|nr:HWE histidine kinase domain-containing protein [Microvirga sp. ACRRW]MCG7394414.1 GAF domain-containing protein [Microvirga sp. ACRRW]
MTLIMGLFGVVFILITFGYIAWEQRNRLIQRNEEEIAGNAYFLADHTARLLEVTDLTLKQVAASVGGRNWDEVETSRPLWHYLATIKETLPYFDDLWLNDSTGRLRLTTREFPTPPANVADRDAFRIQVRMDQGLFVGEPIIGRVTKEPTFMISRRLNGPNNAFDGIVTATVALSYFESYWGKLRLPKGSRVSLVRAADGKIIAQLPLPADGLSFAPIDKDALDAAIRTHSQAGTYAFQSNGQDRTGAYYRVGEKPIYINVSIPNNAYWGPWTVQMRVYGAFALIALLALAALTSLAAQQFREQAANEAFLQKEVALRTSELQAETAALEVLNRTGRALAAELDVDRLIESVVEAAVLLTGAQAGAYFSNRDDAPDGELRAEEYGLYTTGGARTAFAKLPSDRICKAVFEQGRAIRFNDIAEDPEFGAFSDDAHSHDRARARSVMAIPVSSRNGQIQGLLLFAHERAGAFTERAERLVTGLAAQAAVAIENGRLYSEAQHEIEERKQAQSQQSFLIRELHHRVKNTLATVQAVVGATARSTSSIDEFYKAFVGRIVSLANTHSLLTEAVWQTAPLREILEKELKPYNDVRGERITLEGPAVELPSEIAVPIGMAVHELTTNAAKYGALSVRNGRVSVIWSVHGEGDGKRLIMTWEELGGPIVSQPERQGFGSRLLHRVLTTQLNAKVEVNYDPEGLHVAIDAPLKSTANLSPPI